MAGKGLAAGAGRTNGSAALQAPGNDFSLGIASEFDRSMNKAGYIDDVPLPVMVLDCDHNIEYLNRAAASLAGSTPEACIGRKLWDLFDSEQSRNGTCVADRAIRDGRSASGTGEYLVKAKGQSLPVLVHASPRYDDQSRIIGVVQVIQDNSEDTQFANELSRLVTASVNGDLRERGKADELQGRNRDLMNEVNAMLDAVIGPLNVTASYVDRISKGDIPPRITDAYNGDFNAIKNNLNQCIEALSGLIQQMNHMSAQHDLGEIDEFIPAESFQGAYRTMAEGVNNMVKGHISVKKKAMACVAEFGRGNFEAELEKFPGKKAFINENLERLRNNLKAFIEEMRRMSEAHNAGDIDAVIPEEKFEGSYRVMAEGVNNMVMGHISVKKKAMACIKEFGEGNFEAALERFPGKKAFINDTIEQVRTNLKALIADADTLVQAAVQGKLSTRADASRHHGDFRRIVEGVNSTLDAVVGPLQDVSGTLTKLAGGDFTALVTHTYAGDYELLTGAVNTLSKSVRSALEQIGRNVSLLASSSEELNKVSQSMGSNADETATQANVVSAAAEQVSNNVQTVATGAEEMSASIKEIAKNTAEATRVASSAVRTAEVTNGTISKLGQSSAEIGQVIKVITSIAQQTNLLALNATIEAARAGEAGKGFAVVANEVKELAKETAKATEDISRKIEAIQGDTNGAVSAITQISQVIGQISDIQTTIASAIEEQSATTNEIGRTLAEAAKGSTDISKNIGGVAEAARATTIAATDTSKSAHSLEKMAAELQTLVSQFRY